MTSLRARIKQLPRIWQVALVSLLVLYACYLLVGNVFLNTPLFDALTNRKPQKFQMRTGIAITPFPCWVVAWSVHVHGHVQHTVYDVRADRATARIAVLPLLWKTVEFPVIRATHVRAEIDLVDQVVPSPPRSDQGWTLRFDAISSDSIDRARLENLVLEGQGSGSVAFTKQIHGGPSELLPSSIAFDDAQIRAGKLGLIEHGRIRADFSYPRHYRDQAPGVDKLSIIDGRLQLDADSLALKVDTGGGNVGVSTVPAASHLRADLALHHGELQPNSQLSWRFPIYAGPQAKSRGMLSMSLDVDRDIALHATLPEQPDNDSMLDAELRIAGRQVPFRDPGLLIPRVSGHVRGHWRFESLNWISELLVRKSWFALRGGGTLDADLKIERGQLADGSRINVPEVDAVADVMGNRARGHARANGRIDGEKARIDVVMTQFDVAPVDAPEATFVRGNDLELRLSGSRRLREFRDRLKARLQFRNAQVPDVSAYNRYLPRHNVVLLGGYGSASGDFTLDAGGEVGRGSLQLSGRDAGIQVAGVRLHGDADFNVQLQRVDLQRNVFDVKGSRLALSNVSVDGDEHVRSWWANVEAAHGHVDASKPFRVDAVAGIEMKDASLLLAMFANKTDYPQWVFSLVDAGEVDADARLRWQRERLVVDELRAHNDRLTLQARLDLADEHDVGALYLRWGVLGAAVELDHDKRDWHLLHAREWYASQPRILPEMRTGATQ